MDPKRSQNRCQAISKTGKPCRAAATPGGLCFFHANPAKASELGRIGGRSNRHVAIGNADSLPILDNALAVRDMVAQLVADIYAGKTHPRIAAGLASLLNLQLRAIEITEITKIPELERRLAEMEKAMAKTKPAGGSDGRKDASPQDFRDPAEPSSHDAYRRPHSPIE
jgi:hypothetical protein